MEELDEQGYGAWDATMGWWCLNASGTSAKQQAVSKKKKYLLK